MCGNLLFFYEVHNRSVHINGLLNNAKVDIESVLSEKGKGLSGKPIVYIHGSLKSLVLMKCSEEAALWNLRDI